MPPTPEVVITGLGVVSPIGIGAEAFWQSLVAGRSGVRPITSFDSSALSFHSGAEVLDFDPKEFVTPRKSLKVMSRDIQLAFGAAVQACRDANVGPESVDPERLGVIFGADMIYCEPIELIDVFRHSIVDGRFDFTRWGPAAMSDMPPLWLLKYLPNMPACHIAISHDARGPNNSITVSEVSSLLALAEATRVIERGLADVIITGGTGTRIHPTSWVFRDPAKLSRYEGPPAEASRPFDADRDGMIYGEGAAAFIVESRGHAAARGARVLARVLSYSSTIEPHSNGRPIEGRAIRAAIEQALRGARLSPADIGHVNANGLSTIEHDRAEAQAIRDTLGDVPVTAPKSYFGNLGGGTGSVEMAATVLALVRGEVAPTLNYRRPDPLCPINVIHGGMARIERRTAMLLNQTTMGQSAAVVLAGEGA